MKCPQCQRDFPAELLSQMAIAGAGEELRYELKCPPCALKTQNEAHGLPEGTPFSGPRARAMYERAMLHLKQTGQP
jgi:hypothetical protein